jgi:polyisoprenyl-teichoic acid--peptidoglycan teichoic acid transferase
MTIPGQVNPFDQQSERPGAAVDPLADTQPSRLRGSLSDYQPVPVDPYSAPVRPQQKKRWRPGCGCFTVLLLAALLAGYVFFPLRTNIILMGIDDRTPGSAVGRSDTLVLLTFQPFKRYVGMLSIPRDLWVQIPGRGENRINTAHFFAEAAEPGSGPQAVKSVIQANFGVSAHYFVRARFDSFIQVIDTMGGVEIDLPEAMSGYPPGAHRLSGEQALAFVRDRLGADDFSRMRKGQILIRSLVASALSPGNWPHWPQMTQAVLQAVETDIPLYLWPKLGFAFLIASPDGVDARIIDREMVTPFRTDQGAQVLARAGN